MHLTKVFLTLGLPERTRTCGRSHQHPGLRSISDKRPFRKARSSAKWFARLNARQVLSNTSHSCQETFVPLWIPELSEVLQEKVLANILKSSTMLQQCGLFPLGHIWKKATKQQRWVFSWDKPWGPSFKDFAGREEVKMGRCPTHTVLWGPEAGPGKKGTQTNQRRNTMMSTSLMFFAPKPIMAKPTISSGSHNKPLGK